MELELRFFATFRAAVGQKTIHRRFPDGATVGEILRSLEEEFEGLDGELLEDGEIRDQLSVLKNGREVLHMEGIDTVMQDGDRLSVFPPVAGGATDDGAADETPAEGVSSAGTADGGERRIERSWRGISERLALEYLEGLGGERVDEHAVDAGGWRARTSAEKVSIYEGSTVKLTEVTVVFEGDPETLDDLVDRFARKAMRAGG
ncbi:MAG: ubiquitin-like small modifier protein 1 [Haloarculaceae archaeon]